jgi:transposase
MGKVIRIGLDTSKHVFQVHGVDSEEGVVLRRQLKRSQVADFFAGLEPCLIGLEACGGAHHWARVLQCLGHDVRLLPPQYVKPYVKRSKSDKIDAEAICEALGRPSMRFVPIKSEAEQAALMLLGVRDLLVKQRTMLSNAMRGYAAEFGVIGAKGWARVAELLARAKEGLPLPAYELLGVLAGELVRIEAELRRLDRQLMAWHKRHALSQLLATIPGVGPITAVTMVLKVPDPGVFRSARHFAAWVGLTPRENSTAGRQRLGKISREGDETLRRLLVVGATAVIKVAQRPGRGSDWLRALLARKPPKLAAVALANKMARIIWAMMVSGEVYRRPQAA